MNKADVAHWLSILANIGVIAGIVFLGIEIRQTNRAVTGAAYQARSLAVMQRQDMLAESEYLSPIVLKLRTVGYDALSAQEKTRLHSTFIGAMFRLDGTFYQCQLHLLDSSYCDGVFRGEMSLWVPRWRDSGVLDDWGHLGLIREEFADEIDKYLDLPAQNEYSIGAQ